MILLIFKKDTGTSVPLYKGYSVKREKVSIPQKKQGLTF